MTRLMQEPACAPPTTSRRPLAILAAAVEGGLHPTDREVRLRLLSGTIRAAAGTIISVSAQSLLAEFDSVAEAFTCALRIQAEPRHGRTVRIGLASDSAVSPGLQPAEAVVLAQQLRAVAPEGGIALSSILHAALSDMLPLPATQMPQPILGELPMPVAAVTISAADCQTWHQPDGVMPAPAGTEPEERLLLAIVPFRAANGQVLAFADAVSDDAIRVLGASSRWIIVARAPIPMTWGPVDLRQVRQICDARYILHGSADQERGGLRLTVELNEAATGRVLWSDRFDNATADAAALRDICAPRIAGAVAPALVRRELERTAGSPLNMLSAQEIALRALAAILQPERDSFAKAAGWLRHALQRPKPHGAVHYANVIWHIVALAQGWTRDPAASGRAMVRISEHLDRNDPASLALLGYVQAIEQRDHMLACATLDRVIDQAPFSPAAWSLKARVLIQMGEGHEAVFHVEQAEALPAMGFDQAWRSTITAMAYYAADRYTDAARWARTAAMHHPGFTTTHRVLAASLAVLGQLDDARQAGERMLQINPEFRISSWRLYSALNAEMRERYAQRLRLAGLPE